jgi:tetratricopeptide (TPR) repeat protein
LLFNASSNKVAAQLRGERIAIINWVSSEMRVFLSHSSKDKGYVDAVSDQLKPGTFEKDSETFDAGSLSSQAIIESLRRCDLFCLFLSSNSVISNYVDFETLLGVEFLASGKIGKFVALCLDESAFESASANVRFFNIVRRSADPDAAARLIQGYLVSAAGTQYQTHPFLGRDEEMLELEKRATDHRRPNSKAIFISGNFGAGRRTLAQQFYDRRYPQVGSNFPSINVDAFAGLEELYRKILGALRPTIRVSELTTRIQAFAIATNEEKARLTAQLFNSLLPAREASILLDTGGILADSGELVAEINEVISNLSDRPYPPVIIIAPRMVPSKMRRPQNDVCYVAIKSLKRGEAERLISGLLKDRSVTISDGDLIELVRLGDGHPYNIYRMVDDVVEQGVAPFLANPSGFIDWKHRQSSEYVSKVILSDTDAKILALLKQLPELDFGAIVSALQLDAAQSSEDLLRLSNLHLVESTAGVFSVSPALRVAIERDRRIKLPSAVERDAMKSLASSLTIRLEEGTASIALIDAAILASLESGAIQSEFISVFLLPSHAVWLAKRHYDQRHWPECIRFAKEALKVSGRLSSQGFVAACRFLCLAAARVGETSTFEDGIKRLHSVAKNDWAKSNIAFLQGFNFRLQGNLPQAETYFRDSYARSPGNMSAAREIAAICLARDTLDEAEQFAREAHSHAPNNPYLLDILISVLVRKHGRSSKHSTEINAMFDALEVIDRDDGRSFFTTRKAEFEHLWGNNRVALQLIEKATTKTPTIFEPLRLHAEILLKDGNKIKAREIIRKMEEMVNAKDPNERRTNYRLYLETYCHYLMEVEQYGDAKAIYKDAGVFTEGERISAVKNVEVVQAHREVRH